MEDTVGASGVDFGTVPRLVHHDPSIKFKEIGRSLDPGRPRDDDGANWIPACAGTTAI